MLGASCGAIVFAGKSTLWTDTGVDQNFQRDLAAIGPYEFQGKFVWTNGPFALFSRKFIWTNGTESSSKVSTETGIGPLMVLPSFDVFLDILWSFSKDRIT